MVECTDTCEGHKAFDPATADGRTASVGNAIGAKDAVRPPGQSTGVYTTLPGQNAVKHCTVTIG
ncbi:hypothetical protein [Anaeromassilibacillus sp. SJQ-1]|uniref:hypothetical protein n=1 Tax=Anaeromassilibacillus sp. SJQ-1 TaxID=3375419 RepID=UPI003989576C